VTGVVGGLVAGTLLDVYGEKCYKENYNTYVKIQAENPNIPISPSLKGTGFNVKFGGR
jgi:hypothetical protein